MCVTNFQSVSDGQLFPGTDGLGYFLLAHLVANPYPPGQGKNKQTNKNNKSKQNHQTESQDFTVRTTLPWNLECQGGWASCQSEVPFHATVGALFYCFLFILLISEEKKKKSPMVICLEIYFVKGRRYQEWMINQAAA